MLVGALAIIGYLAVCESVTFGRRLLAYARLRRLVDSQKEAPVEEQPKPDNRQGLIEGVLTEIQRWQLRRAVESDGRLSIGTRKGLVEALDFFRTTELVPARLDFDKLDKEAERRHCSQADAIYDLARGRDVA